MRDEKIPVIACDNDPTSKVLNLWPEETGICHVNKFLEILEALDRFDVIDDTIELIGNVFLFNYNFIILRYFPRQRLNVNSIRIGLKDKFLTY